MHPVQVGRRTLLAALVAFLALFVAAPGARAAAAEAPAADDAAILPYIDEGTYLVGRLDVARVDQDALVKYFDKATDAMLKTLPIPAGAVGQVKAEATKQANEAKQWLTNLAESGGKRLYLLADTADLASNGGPIVVVPFATAEDGDKIKDVMTPNGTGGDETVAVGNAIVHASAAQLERLRKRLEPGVKPVERPDLARAFAAAGADAPVRLALVPGESSRKWVEENLPALPPMLGGGDTKVLSRGLRYATVAVVQKPDDAVATVSLRCEDADKAKALLDVVNKGAAFVKQSAAAAGEERAEEIGKEIDAIKPKLAADTITLSLDPILVLTRFGRAQATAEVQAAPPAAPAQPGQPPKKDDGGL